MSRPTVRTILRQAGIAAVRKRGVKRHYKRRERRAQEGALLLWDGSPHHWFGKELHPLNLTAVIDDATGAFLHGVFTLEEDAQSYLLCLRAILLEKGIPLGLYMDRHGIFRRNDDHWSLQEQLLGEQTPTQVAQRYGSWALKRSMRSRPKPRAASSDYLTRCKTVWFTNSGLQGFIPPNKRRAFSTAPSKRISTLGLPSPLGKAKPLGGRYPKGSMSIGSAALAIKPPSATIMRFASEESFWISRQDRAIEAMPKPASRFAISSTDAGVCTLKTSCSWRQPRPCYKHR